MEELAVKKWMCCIFCHFSNGWFGMESPTHRGTSVVRRVLHDCLAPIELCDAIITYLAVDSITCWDLELLLIAGASVSLNDADRLAPNLQCPVPYVRTDIDLSLDKQHRLPPNHGPTTPAYYQSPRYESTQRSRLFTDVNATIASDKIQCRSYRYENDGAGQGCQWEIVEYEELILERTSDNLVCVMSYINSAGMYERHYSQSSHVWQMTIDAMWQHIVHAAHTNAHGCTPKDEWPMSSLDAVLVERLETFASDLLLRC